MRWPIALALAAAVQAGGAAEVYRSTGPAGEPAYSDVPTPGAQPVEIEPPPVYAAPPPPPPAAGNAGEERAPAYAMLRIAAPAAQAVHWKADGPLPVVLEADPPLAPGHVAVLEVDGAAQVRAPAGAPLSLPVETLPPGTHALAVVVQDAQGRALGRTAPVEVHIRQHNLNLPARPAPPRPQRPGGGTGPRP